MIGQVVEYTFNDRDEQGLAQGAPRGAVAGVRVGRLPVAGETTRGWIVRDHSDGTANLSVLIDGNLPHFVRDAREGNGPGKWSAVV